MAKYQWQGDTNLLLDGQAVVPGAVLEIEEDRLALVSASVRARLVALISRPAAPAPLPPGSVAGKAPAKRGRPRGRR